MLIKELRVKNFQIHKDIVVKLTKGLNVIIGDTDAGKSGLVRSLFLTIMNQPRSGESIYQNKHTKNPIDIYITDDKGNVIRRHKKRYYLNGESLKAFGTSIPAPVAELFPFKSINWQKQLDSHFLILQTGGNAAKTLNASTGMEDQELLMKEVKIEITDHKSNIKRLIKNNQEHKKTIHELKGVTRLFMKAKAIKNIESNSEQLLDEMNELAKFITELNKYKTDPFIYAKLDLFLNDIKIIESSKIQSNDLNVKINQLSNICTQLKEVEKHSGKSKIYNIFLQSIISIKSESIKESELKVSINNISSIIDSIKNIREEREHFIFQLERMENEFSEKLLEMGECPLCGTKFGKGKHSC